jgi:hypothetical protein
VTLANLPQEGTTQYPVIVPPETRDIAAASQNEETRFTSAVQKTGASQAYQGLHPLAYRGMQVGPNLKIDYEQNTTVPINATKPMLRQLSPFIVQLEPPLVYGEDGGFLNQQKANGIWSPDAISAASAPLNNDGYTASRVALNASGLSNLKYNVGSVGEFITQNSSGGVSSNITSTGEKTDNQGNKIGRLGEPAIADMYAAVDIAWQLSVSLNTPPLVMLINPSSLTINYTKVQQFSDRSRYGYIFQAWGEEQVKLSITAKCGGFVSGQRGYQFSSKRDSAAWQNWMNMYHFYRNNGYIYDTIGRSFANHFVGALSIRYDNWIYYGHMESFTYAYDENTQQGGMEFSIEFVASSMVDLAQQVFTVLPMKSPIPSLSDPRYAGIQNQARNQPGNYSIGIDGDGYPRLSSQGLTVMNTPFLPKGSRVGKGLESLNQPEAQSGGFSSANSSTQKRQVEQATGKGLFLFTRGK